VGAAGSGEARDRLKGKIDYDASRSERFVQRVTFLQLLRGTSE
jgi:hypothetical protein